MTVCRAICQFFVKRQLFRTRSAETASMVIGLCGRFAKITFPLVENHHTKLLSICRFWKKPVHGVRHERGSNPQVSHRQGKARGLPPLLGRDLLICLS